MALLVVMTLLYCDKVFAIIRETTGRCNINSPKKQEFVYKHNTFVAYLPYLKLVAKQKT